MLKQFCIKNFKGFKEQAKIEFAPITLIYGPNSAGKSSIIHALMLLQQSIAKPTKTSGLVSNGDMIDLGNYLTMVNQHNTDLDIEFKLVYSPIKYKVSAGDEIQTSFGSKNDREHSFIYGLYKNNFDQKIKNFSYLKNINFEVKNSENNKNFPNILDIGFISRLNNSDVKEMKDAFHLCKKFTYDTNDSAYNHASYVSKRLGVLERDHENLTKQVFEIIRISDFSRDPSFATPSTVNGEITIKKNKNPVSLLSELEAGRTLYDLSRELKEKLNTISYLGPLRSYPARIYSIAEDYKNSVGKLGENVATFLYSDEEDGLLNN